MYLYTYTSIHLYIYDKWNLLSRYRGTRGNLPPPWLNPPLPSGLFGFQEDSQTDPSGLLMPFILTLFFEVFVKKCLVDFSSQVGSENRPNSFQDDPKTAQEPSKRIVVDFWWFFEGTSIPKCIKNQPLA